MAQTDLVNRKQNVTVDAIQNETGGGKKILLRITSKGVTEEYNMTQIGIWGQCGTKGSCLFALLQDTKGISIPAETVMPDFLLEFYATVVVSGNVNFTYNVDPTALVSTGDLQEALSKTEGKLSDAEISATISVDDSFAMVSADGSTTRVPLSSFDDRYKTPEYDGVAAFPTVGESGRLYVDTDLNVTYRWDGNTYVQTGVGLGETDSTAYRGDRGKIAYDHSQAVGNPHGTTAEQITYVNAEGETVTAQVGIASALSLAQEAKDAADANTGGCMLHVTFSDDFLGKAYTVTSAAGESYTGTVPEGLAVDVTAKNCNTVYTVTATANDDKSYRVTVTTGAYFGQYPVTLTTFSATLTVTTTTGALVTAVSGSYTYSATADSSGKAILTIQKAGTYAVTATLSGDTDSGSVAVTTNGSAYTLSLPFVSTTLGNNSWEKIRKISDAGTGANYWKLGDSKPIIVNGTVGNMPFVNLAFGVFIIGFNHNGLKEGKPAIHFQLGITGGMHVALCDNSYATGVSATGYFSMNVTNTNSGGWRDSYHRKTLLGNSGTPAAPAANSLLAALPADLRAVMKVCVKYTDNAAGNAGDVAGNVSGSNDYLFELSEFEYHGVRTYANSAEQNYQKQYDYYKAGNSKIKYKHNGTTTAANVWCRSPYAAGNNSFCFLSSTGTASSSHANYSYGLAPGFCV